MCSAQSVGHSDAGWHLMPQKVGEERFPDAALLGETLFRNRVALEEVSLELSVNSLCGTHTWWFADPGTDGRVGLLVL